MTGIHGTIGGGSRFRVNRLAVCLSAALVSVTGAELAMASSPVAKSAVRHAEHHPTSNVGPAPSAPTIWTVQNCTDHDADSLRDIIENPMKAKSGDKIDLGGLPAACGMVDSTITLTGGEIAVHQDDIYLYGPAMGTVTISGGGMSRVLHHDGTGLLSVNGLTVSDGYYHSMGAAYGGCIESDVGNIDLNRVVIRQCRVVSDSSYGNGGGVSAFGNVTLIASLVSGNRAEGGINGWGGGVYSKGTVFAKYSSISGNTAKDGPSNGGWGGGIAAKSGATLIASTIDSNIAGNGGGIRTSGQTTILNSTISGNVASYRAAGTWARRPMTIANSTIVFNHQGASAQPAGGIYFYGPLANDTLTLQSSIIANNTAGPANVPTDVYVDPGHGALAGADNLVIASNVTDPAVITVMADPQLGPLQFNGGPTRTHQLLASSPALGKGNTTGLPPSIASDQRGPGYPRKSGPNAIADLGAVQFDAIFVDGLDSQLH